MNRYLFLLAGILMAAVIYSCNDPAGGDKIRLDKKYKKVKRIQVWADCEGPRGPYTTEIHSFEDGYMYFRQKFTEQPGEFKGILIDHKTGYSLDINDEPHTKMGSSHLQVIRDHDFHRIVISPESFASDLTYLKDTVYRDQYVKMFLGVDKSAHKATIYYNPETQVITGIERLNQADTTETIEIFLDDWRKTDHGSLPYRAEIVQAERDTYSFNYTQLVINDMDAAKFEGP